MIRAARLDLAIAVLAALAIPAVAENIELPRPVPPFNQAYTDGPDAWGGCQLGTAGCPDQICTTGCLTTAFASVLAYHGIELTVDAQASCTGRARTGMDPGILNDWLRANEAYGRCAQDPIGSCCLVWGSLPAEIELAFHVNRSDVGINPVASVVIDHALRQGNPVIAGVHWGAFCHGSTTQSEDCHWVVLTERFGDTYTIIDPYNEDATSPYGVRTTLDAGVHGAYIIDRFVIVERVNTTLGPTESPASPSGDPSDSGSVASFVAFAAVLAAVAALIVLVTAAGNR